jgi:2'-5' RNA ligase
MRLFTGLALDEKTTDILGPFVSSFQREFPTLRWSHPQQWHVTLQFLGEIKDDRYSCIVERLQAIRANAVEVRLGTPDFFERAGVFHIAIEKTETLLALHRTTQQALLPCGFGPEGRPYSPHITLARNKGRAPSSDFKRLRREAEKHAPVTFPPFVTSEFFLYQSFTGPSGPRYEVRERFALM